jgi:hypothetical protein
MSRWKIPPTDSSEVFLERLRELEPQANRRVKNQHVVSRVILKGFAAPGSSATGWQLTPFDLRLGSEQRSRGLKGCGKVPDFLLFASESAEQLWQAVETQLNSAVAAARAGHLHDQTAYVEAVIDGISLHLVRSLRYRDMHRTFVSQSIEDIRQTALDSRRAMLQAEFQRRYGLAAAGPEALAMILEEPISRWRSLDARGGIVRVSMEGMFRRVREAIRGQAVEIWHVPSGCELLISDSPAFTFRYSEGNTHIEANVAIGDSHGIAMPLARDCLAAIGPVNKDDELSPDQVSLFNRLQIELAYRYVYYHPGSALRTFVQAIARPEG